VVELATLERWYTRKGIVGSNPTLSASIITESKALSLCSSSSHCVTRWRLTVKSFSKLLLAVCILSISITAYSQEVHVIKVEATINPASADFIHESIQRAVESNAECLVIKLNTPGGLLKSTRSIVTDLLTAGIPVIVYVHPAGAQSASAGAFITLAAHVAAMAPGTNIGAAHPVGLQGQMDSVMMEKATNDAAAFIRTISEKRKRNVQWAEDAVRKSVSITETEALRDSVIDVIATDIKSLLEKIDGKVVDVQGGRKKLSTKDAAIMEFDMDWKYKVLDLLSDPNIAYIFFLLGVYGLIYELYNPGAILPGVVGVISIILAFYSMATLPVNYAGLALIVVGIVLFILELKITSYGLLSIGGIVSLLLGSIMLINSDSYLEFARLSWAVIIPSILLTAGFFIFAIGYGIKAQKRKPTTGIEGMIGETGEAISDLNPDGQVRVHGEIWSATSIEGKIRIGGRVRVEKLDNLRLIVKKSV
jgi:membrane-bound serine protease (ClpP class)